MPCYLFAYHAYGSWMPDRPQGYVHWKEGLKPPDKERADEYRRKQSNPTVVFERVVQQHICDGVREACSYLDARCHAVATDPSHAHTLISWRTERNSKSISRSLKISLSRRLNEQIARQQWFSKGGSRQAVKVMDHFDHLMRVYLPRHRGVLWDRGA
ncbi:transposase [Adhaeretor mobilis]|uniref:Transposase IS200-like domain-containing protein n=1 Tax=Adhaeretor mobilis TaxID=1930276 RepID=A0A517N2J6_9BACT|nr:transposase [Adhaeretor mobilis]QDT01351.1 hypothetical protein HG15A2_46930 [Adhaeretor mobilis]